MTRRYGGALLPFVAMSSSKFALNSAVTGLNRGAVAPSAYILNLQPPANTDHEAEASLDAILKAEDERRQVSDSEFEAAKQRMISAEKQWIHETVQRAFVARA